MEEWFRIVNGQIWLTQQSYGPGEFKILFLLSISRTNEWILIKFYIHIDIDYI